MKSNHAEEIIVKLLRVGVVISALLIGIGFVLLYAKGDSGYIEGTSITFNSFINGLIQLKPYYVIMLGLLVLIITPVLRVAISIVVFKLEKDYLYVKVTTVVLVILVISFFIGLFSQNVRI